MILVKTFKFDSAHKLNNYIGPCQNLHGHSWVLKVSLDGQIDPATDMLVDFKEVKRIVQENVIDKLDHKYLNEVLDFNPTAENLTKYIWSLLVDKFPNNIKLQRIKLAETEGNYIAYYGN
jgi:6-pyruvoyltetrahydropterin/6-carboxytetrahydropterin synthase